MSEVDVPAPQVEYGVMLDPYGGRMIVNPSMPLSRDYCQSIVDNERKLGNYAVLVQWEHYDDTPQIGS